MKQDKQKHIIKCKHNLSDSTLSTLNEWKNTESIINWLKNTPNKHSYTFLMFDIKNYPSIKQKLLWEAIKLPNIVFL